MFPLALVSCVRKAPAALPGFQFLTISFSKAFRTFASQAFGVFFPHGPLSSRKASFLVIWVYPIYFAW